MNPRILGIIGGLALVVALLSPFMMGSSKKVEQLFNPLKTSMDKRIMKVQSLNILRHSKNQRSAV